jgi:hypothetical protein
MAMTTRGPLSADQVKYFESLANPKTGYEPLVAEDALTTLRLNTELEAALARAERAERAAVVWREGWPDHVYASEWFLAKVKGHGPAVLKALPKDYSHDFKTADETYLKKESVTHWAQFPESEFISPDESLKRDLLAAEAQAAALMAHIEKDTCVCLEGVHPWGSPAVNMCDRCKVLSLPPTELGAAVQKCIEALKRAPACGKFPYDEVDGIRWGDCPCYRCEALAAWRKAGGA